jgi:hypothetical protein
VRTVFNQPYSSANTKMAHLIHRSRETKQMNSYGSPNVGEIQSCQAFDIRMAVCRQRIKRRSSSQPLDGCDHCWAVVAWNKDSFERAYLAELQGQTNRGAATLRQLSVRQIPDGRQRTSGATQGGSSPNRTG